MIWFDMDTFGWCTVRTLYLHTNIIRMYCTCVCTILVRVSLEMRIDIMYKYINNGAKIKKTIGICGATRPNVQGITSALLLARHKADISLSFFVGANHQIGPKWGEKGGKKSVNDPSYPTKISSRSAFVIVHFTRLN